MRSSPLEAAIRCAWMRFKCYDTMHAELAFRKRIVVSIERSQAPPPKDRSIYGFVVAEGQADIFLTYCTNAIVAQRENAGQQVVALPASLAVGADYGMTVVHGASTNAERFAAFILSPEAQAILAKHGFSGAR